MPLWIWALNVIVAEVHRVEVHAHPIDRIWAGIVAIDSVLGDPVGAPDHRDVGCIGMHYFSNAAESSFVSRRVTVVRNPVAIHFARKAQKNRGAGTGDVGGERLEVARVPRLGDVLDVHHDLPAHPATCQLPKPVDGSRTTVGEIHKCGCVAASDALIEVRPVAVELPIVAGDLADGIIPVDTRSEKTPAGWFIAR